MHNTPSHRGAIVHLLAAITALVLVTGCVNSSPSHGVAPAVPPTAASSSAAAPAPTATSVTAPPPGDATDFSVTGTVDTSPACPGPVSTGSPCPDRPLAGATITAMRGATAVATTHTDPAGHYRLTLRRGTYRLTATGTTGYRSYAARTITVPPDVVVDLTIDSGMR